MQNNKILFLLRCLARLNILCRQALLLSSNTFPQRIRQARLKLSAQAWQLTLLGERITAFSDITTHFCA